MIGLLSAMASLSASACWLKDETINHYRFVFCSCSILSGPREFICDMLSNGCNRLPGKEICFMKT